ncbi:MAG: oligoendopeptidase F [Clostridia bacterium]|nr:oligoendopeptidase F [Clostridia bacterium]
MESKLRRDMNPEFTWDLTPVFKDVNAWEAAYAEAEQAVKALDTLPGTLGWSAEHLQAGLDQITRAQKLAERVYDYAFLCKSTDNGDPQYQEMEARAIGLLVALETAAAFVEPEILQIPAEMLAMWLEQDALKTYRHMTDDIARRRDHTLDAQGERLLAMLGDVAQTPGNTFDMFESVDMKLPTVRNEAGERVPLTHGGFTVFRESRNPRVRREAFEAYFGSYGDYINTLASIYGGAVKLNCFNADARGFKDACEAALFGNNVPVSLYDSLIETVHGALPDMRAYLALRQRKLGLDALHLYDLYAPIVEDVDYQMPYADACALVKEALLPLGEEYQRLLDRAFAEKWIDVYENQGKSTGAFSMGVYGAHPYVLLNYTGKLDDAYTLAHELGHSMHSFFSDRAQDYANHDYRIFVAEVASTVNEVLLTHHLLKKEQDPKRRAYVLNHYLEGFRTTVFRQTLFAEFERKAHALYQSGTPLTAQTLNGVYHELNALYYAGAEIDAFADVEWARIPHFYNAFYVYQYATGFSSAVAIADDILRTGDAGRYLKFLSTGGSDYPIEELKIAGVDLTKPDAVRHAMAAFKRALAELEETLNK